MIDSFPEYSIVKKYTDKKILLLGETLPENYRKFDTTRVTFCVYNKEVLQRLAKLSGTIKVHLFLNTGMYREWINQFQLAEIIPLLLAYKNIHVEWVLSHLHSADSMGEQTIHEQIQIFKTMYYMLLDAWLTPQYRYIGNSAWLAKIKDDFFNAYRPGIALYGYNPLQEHDEYYDVYRKLKPALSIVSRVLNIHEIPEGQWVSYDYQRISTKPTSIGVIPFGYAEGLPRNASNKIAFKRKWKKIDQVGRITMNLSLCDLKDYNVRYGDEVEIISPDPKADNSIYKLAQASWTIVYEVLVKLDRGLRREVV